MQTAQSAAAIVITGASSGIGQATAYRLARRERMTSLILHGRNEERLASVAGECEALGASVVICAGDLRSGDSLDELIAVCKRQAHLRALVNNAGAGSFASMDQLPPRAWEDMLRLNLTVPFLLTRALISQLKGGSEPSTVVNVSSDGDSLPFVNATAYCASKAGLLALSRTAALELRALSVRICTVSPGRVDTCFNGKHPGMRPGSLQPDEVAEVIEFAIYCSHNIELQEIRVDSMSRPQ
jgi:NAD(P)-dependent dehydrogenase (short-subunit alcohol dehydrogenase family)